MRGQLCGYLKISLSNANRAVACYVTTAALIRMCGKNIWLVCEKLQWCGLAQLWVVPIEIRRKAVKRVLNSTEYRRMETGGDSGWRLFVERILILHQMQLFVVCILSEVRVFKHK